MSSTTVVTTTVVVVTAAVVVVAGIVEVGVGTLVVVVVAGVVSAGPPPPPVAPVEFAFDATKMLPWSVVVNGEARSPSAKRALKAPIGTWAAKGSRRNVAHILPSGLARKSL